MTRIIFLTYLKAKQGYRRENTEKGRKKLLSEEEYFVEKKDGVVVRDVIFAYTKRPRTAIGIKDNDVYIIVATNARPLTLKELASVCSDLQLDKAMNFDGGGSTSLDYQGSNDTQFKNLHIASEKNNAPRKLKSFLVIE